MAKKKDGKNKNGKKILLIASSFLVAIFNTVALLYIARNLGTEMLGALAFLLSFVGLFAIVGDMGHSFAFQAAVSDGYPFSKCFSKFKKAKLGLAFVLTLISSGMILIYGSFLSSEDDKFLHVAAMVPMLCYFVSNSIAQIWITGSNIKGKNESEKVYEGFDAFIKLVLIIGVVNLGFLENDQAGVFNLSFIYLLASSVGLMVLINSSRKLRKGDLDEKIDSYFILTSKKILPYLFFTSLILNVDKILIWHWWSLADLGLYFGAQRIVIFIGASSAAIGTILGGAVMKFQNDQKDLVESLRLTERYITLLAVPVTAFYIAFAYHLLTQFLGPSFATAEQPVIILAVSGLFIALSTPSLLYLLQKRDYKYLGTIAAVSLAMNICLGLLLIPGNGIAQDIEWMHGINGAAIALLVSNAIAFFGFRIKVMLDIGFKPHPRIAFHFLASGILFVILKFMIWLWDIDVKTPHIFMFAIFAAIIYFFLLYLGGEMLKYDFYRFKDLVNNE